MKVLITGGAGFIGSHIVDRFVDRGDDVVVVDNLSAGKKDNLSPSARLIELDINAPELSDLFNEEHFDLINHHAAQADAARAVIEPVADARTNVLGTINVMENAARFGVKKIIFASSAAVYGEQIAFPANEDHPQRPVNPYGVAKAAAEGYVAYYGQANKMKCCIFRYANVYGPRQDPLGEGGAVSVFTRKLISGEVPMINGDGNQTRDFIYVGDIADANLIAADGDFDGVCNLSTGIETSIIGLYGILSHLTGNTFDPVFGPERAGDQRRSSLDNVRAKSGLKWEPATALADGLKATVEYFEKAVSI